MTTRLDSDSIMYGYLTSVTALMTATGNRIYGPPLGVPAGITEPKTFIKFSCDGGPGHPDIPMSSERFSFSCYGSKQSEAQSVFRALFDALHRVGRQEVTISVGVTALLRRADLESGPMDLPEPELGWPRVVCAFRVVFMERAL